MLSYQEKYDLDMLRANQQLEEGREKHKTAEADALQKADAL